MNKNKLFPITILLSFIVLVPVLRCTLFFDSYLIKLWVAQFGTGILFIYYLWHVLFRKEKTKIDKIIVIPLLAYFLINILSWFRIPHPHRYPALLTLNILFVYVLVCFLVSQYINKEKIYDFIAILWVLATIGICIFGIWQYLHKERIIGTLGNENFLGSYIGISIPVAIGFFCRYTKTNKKLMSLGMLIILLFIFTLYITHSRGGLLGIFWSLSSFIIIGFCPKGKRILIVILLILLLIAVVFTPLGIKFIDKQFYGDPRGYDVRPALWEGTVSMITEKPLLGWGKGAYFIFYPPYRVQYYWFCKDPKDLTVHAHNEFLQIWAETGLVGLGAFLVFIFIVIQSGIKRIDKLKGRQKYLLLGITSAIIGLLTHNLVCDNLQMPSSAILLWFMLGLVISYIPANYVTVNLKKIYNCGIFLALTVVMAIIIWHTGVRSVVSQFLFKKGWRYREKEKWNPAIEKYEKAIRWYPWDIEMYYRTGYAYTMNKQYNQAIEKYNEVTNLAPFYGTVHRNMGIIYMKKGEYKLATQSFLQQLRINECDSITQVCLNKIKGYYDNR